MAYTGQTVPISLGQLGLHTDDPQAVIPPNAAIKANNVSLYKSVLLKSPGSSQYSATAISSNIVGVFDWWPTPTAQRLIAITSDGKIWKDSGDGSWTSGVNIPVIDTQLITFSALPDAGTFTLTWGGHTTGDIAYTALAAAVQTAVRALTGAGSFTVSGNFQLGFTINLFGTSGSQTAFTATSSLTKSSSGVTIAIAKIVAGNTGSLGTFTTDVHMVAGGAEVAGNARRLFIFTGGVTQVLMLTGDGSALTGIAQPAADWTNNFPTYGGIIQGHLYAFGNANSRHRLYVSTLSDHTDFSTSATDGSGASTFPVFSGEGDGLVSGIVYLNSSLVLAKKPFGTYIFNWNGGDVTDPTNFSITRFSDSFAVGGPHSMCIVESDLWGGSNVGSIFSLQATNAYGSFQKGDVLMSTLTRDYIRQQIDQSGTAHQHAVYYPDKQLAMFTHKAVGGSNQNLILVVDMARSAPRVTFETKDVPTCLALRKDVNGILRPMYGSTDGIVYLMDQGARNVNNTAYTGEFQTPFIDFSYLDQSLADKVKLFDFLQLTYSSTGSWNIFVDVYVDGFFSETLSYAQQTIGGVLDSFVLDQSQLGGSTIAKPIRKKMSSAGKSVSFRIYNSGLNQSFQVERFVIGFRLSAEQNRSSKG